MNFKKFLAILGLAGLMTSCSSGVAMTQREAEFKLFVDVTPKDAIIIVDDVAISTGKDTFEIPLKLQAGTRRIAIVHDGYHTFKTTLEYIQPGETYTLKTTLIASEF